MTRKKNYTPEGKICVNCLIPLDYSNIRPADLAQANYICKRCRKLRDQLRYENRKEIIREQQRGYDLAVKMKVIEAYGWKCNCCDENRYEFLTVDHTNNDGVAERERTKQGTGTKLYRWLVKNNFPKEGYQLLCYNCNCSKGFFGYCPHNKPDIIVRPTKRPVKTHG